MTQPEARYGDETISIGMDPRGVAPFDRWPAASSDECSAPLRVATQLIVEEALEAEVEEALGPWLRNCIGVYQSRRPATLRN